LLKIAITGGTGFIGAKLMEQLQKLGHDVRFLTRDENKRIVGAQAIIGDVNSAINVLLPLLHDVDVFFHCAGELNNESLMPFIHVQGAANMLNIIQQLRIQNQKKIHWVQLSSCGAYGQAKVHPSIARYVDEDTQDNPSGEYECTKTEADNLIISFAKQYNWFKYTIIRPTNVFGFGMRSTAIKRIAQMIKNRLFFYVGNKNSIANFVHVDDVVKAMVLSINQSKAHNQTFIVSNDCKFSDVVDTIADTLQTPKTNWIANEFLLRKSVNLVNKWIKLPISSVQIDVMMRQTYYSSQKISSALDWSPSDSVLVQLKQYVSTIFNGKNS
jgi:nucleoside-diphosphate-sugar epimerase